MKLRIITPNHSILYETEWIEIHTLHGSAVIKHGHAPIIFSLAHNKTLSFSLKNGDIKTFLLERGGFVEVTRKNVIALINQEMSLRQ